MVYVHHCEKKWANDYCSCAKPARRMFCTIRKLRSLFGDSNHVPHLKAHAKAAFKRLAPSSLPTRNFKRVLIQCLCATYTVIQLRNRVSQRPRHWLYQKLSTPSTSPLVPYSILTDISNAYLYKRCSTKPLRNHLTRSQNKLFCHSLRRAQPIHYQLNMARCYDAAAKLPVYWGCTANCTPFILVKDLRLDINSNLRLKNTSDLCVLSIFAQGRIRWKLLTQCFCTGQELFYGNS